ncbi:MAG: hypothetical protein QM215_08160 [Bacillota bacterium]|jgi:nitrate reductase gamma subunit|nr:hypothetical protein [Eubacteriales bacterium]MDI9492870.1 hypothetical protein [Bacillota bacterium]NLV69444.1 hypothetical protein [Clostridiales bacterium]HRV33861.1 hypothetical protein [Anaerovoracaceae bacterium]MDD4286480.1 hypothetical protein [Eubacteriales bacterium]
MKQLIVLVAAVCLGLQLFTMIAGSGHGSVASTLRQVWLQEIEVRRLEDSPEVVP